MLPFYEALGGKVGAILTDNGREFCGIQARRPYELLLAMEDIEHRTTKIRSPRTVTITIDQRLGLTELRVS